MKKITLLHLAQIIFFFILLWIQKANGYTWSIMLGQPSLYFYFIFPAALASGIFGLVFGILTKEMNIYEKIVSLIITSVLSVIIGTAPWIYILVGSSLQIFIYSTSAVFVMLEIVWVSPVKEFIVKNQK